jgi:hypothetical protein
MDWTLRYFISRLRLLQQGKGGGEEGENRGAS